MKRMKNFMYYYFYVTREAHEFLFVKRSFSVAVLSMRAAVKLSEMSCICLATPKSPGRNAHRQITF